MKDIDWELKQILPKDGKIVEFLTNTENAKKINGLVENINEALIKYQVCMQNHLFQP